MPSRQHRQSTSPHAARASGRSDSVGAATSNHAAQAALLGDGGRANTFTYVCTGAETYGDLAKSAGGDYRTAMALNPQVPAEGLAAGVELRLPRTWVDAVGGNDPFLELFAHLGAQAEADPKRVTALWEHLTADERALILKNSRTSAAAKKALGLPTNAPHQDSPSVFEQLVNGSVALATSTATLGEQAEAGLHAATQGASDWWMGIDREAQVAVAHTQVMTRQSLALAHAAATVTPEMKRIQDRKKQMMAVFKQYTQMTLTVPINGVPTEIQVSAKYKISLDEGAKQTPWDVASANERRGEAWATAKSGKATSDSLQHALQTLTEGPLSTSLSQVSSADEARELIESAAHRDLGIDCSGFVFRVLQGVDEAALFTNQAGWTFDPSRATQDASSIPAFAAASGDNMLAGGRDLTGQADKWTTGDIINKSGKGGSGHIVIVYDVKPDGNRQRVQFMESAGREGVRLSTVWYDQATQRWEKKNGRPSFWPNSDCSVIRPKPFQSTPESGASAK